MNFYGFSLVPLSYVSIAMLVPYHFGLNSFVAHLEILHGDAFSFGFIVLRILSVFRDFWFS